MSLLVPLTGAAALLALLLGGKKNDGTAAAAPAPLPGGGRAVNAVDPSPPNEPGSGLEIVEIEEVDEPEPPPVETDATPPVATEFPELNAALQSLDEGESRQWQSAVIKAIASGDAATVSALAKQMRADGMSEIASTLERIAKQWREEYAAATQQTPAQVEQKEPPPPAPPENPVRKVAEALAAYIRSLEPNPRGKENRDEIRKAQEVFGLKQDGLYGPGMAKVIANHGIIPPAPIYWPWDWQAARSDYERFLRSKAVEDPARSDAWLEAAESYVR